MRLAPVYAPSELELECRLFVLLPIRRLRTDRAGPEETLWAPIRCDSDWKRLDEYLSTQEILLVQTPWRTHKKAARIYFECRRNGITIRSTIDCLIAQLVLEADDLLLHDDEDFERIKAVRPLRTIRS